MIRLACPLCEDTGPWASAQERTAHIRAHHTVTCDVCDRPVNASGLDAHMRYMHADDPPAADEPAAPAPAPAVDLVDDNPPDDELLDQPAAEPQVTPVDDPDESADLRCSQCDAGSFADRRGLAAHRRSHETVTCEVCGKPVKANGLGPHMTSHRRAAGAGDPPAPVSDPPGLAPVQDPDPPAPAAEDPAPEPAAAPPTVKVDRVACPECGDMFRPGAGIGNHLASHRRAAARAAAPPPARRPLRDVLAQILPGAADELLDRLSAFVAKYEPDGGHSRWVVATAESGPWLCRTAGISLLVSREHVPCIVVSLDDIYAHTGRRPAETDVGALRPWPAHRKAAAS